MAYFDVIGLVLPKNEAEDFTEILKEFESVSKLTLKNALSLEEPDAVIAETEDKNLNKYALAALSAGYPVHMDKPGGLNLTVFEKNSEYSQRKRITVSFGLYVSLQSYNNWEIPSAIVGIFIIQEAAEDAESSVFYKNIGYLPWI